MELTPPLAKYEQVARQLRAMILDGTYPPEQKLPSGPETGRKLGVSQNMAQKAFELLAREGLVQMSTGSGTTVLRRKAWRVEFAAPLPGDGGDGALQEIESRLEAAAGVQPAVTATSAKRADSEVRVTLTVESADIHGAGAAAEPVARQAFGEIPVSRQVTEEV